MGTSGKQGTDLFFRNRVGPRHHFLLKAPEADSAEEKDLVSGMIKVIRWTYQGVGARWANILFTFVNSLLVAL